MSLRIAASFVLRGTARPNRADRGIYAGRRVNFGMKVTEPKSGHTGGAKRTHRTFLPNVQNKKMYSAVLGRSLELRCTTHAMRCIDKAGGFDSYILNTKEAKLDSQLAVALKYEMLAKLAEGSVESSVESVEDDVMPQPSTVVASEATPEAAPEATPEATPPLDTATPPHTPTDESK